MGKHILDLFADPQRRNRSPWVELGFDDCCLHQSVVFREAACLPLRNFAVASYDRQRSERTKIPKKSSRPRSCSNIHWNSLSQSRPGSFCFPSCECLLLFPTPSGVGRSGGADKEVTWLILPVVICLSQRLSHACLSINNFIL